MRILFTSFAIALASCTTSNRPPKKASLDYFEERMQRVPVVLRVRRSIAGEGSKYLWPRAEVLGIRKNTSGIKIAGSIEFAHLSSGEGFPADECTIYLVPYNAKDNTLHLLKLDEVQEGALTEPGFSHVKSIR